MDYVALLDQQRHFFHTGKTQELKYRKETLLKLKNLIKANETSLYSAIYQDFNKSEFDTYTTELSILYTEIDYYTKNLKKLSKPTHKPTNLANLPGKFYLYPEPLGNILVIGAWNYPYQLTILPVIAAIAAGNTCIIKPSELPSSTMHVIANLINNNFDAQYLYVATGDKEETTKLIRLHFDKIFFTGSPKIGKIIYQNAAKNLTPVTLELGGKSPVIVTSHANLDVTAKRIVWGKFLNAGQTCVAPDYIYVDTKIVQPFIEYLKQYIQNNQYTEKSPHYTKIINQHNFDRIIQQINFNKVTYGGHYNPETLFIEPTILTNITWDDLIMKDEIFGPILPILTYTDINEVFVELQKHEKPLAAYLFSSDIKEQQLFLQKISFGGGCINDVIMHLANNNVPFGGIGNSGIGNYHGKYGFNCFTHHKTIYKKSFFGEPNLKYPPYSKEKLNWIKRLM